jgi:phenylpropionate dioxygenase-like ring-hydroxylating dioxygenase large terminal subunit
MTLAQREEELLKMVDAGKGTVDRRMFFDEDIYQLELERIFARAWNFMCHDSQIPNPGDFFMTFIGEDRVIVVRDNEGNPQVLVNSCRHRGNAVCRADEGHTTSFMCTYHGWTYDLKGALVGVPGFKEVYHEELDRENWGLIKAAQVDTFKGFVFACMDADAPSLPDYLGEVGRLGLSYLGNRGNIKMIGGVQKFTIPCNWKLAVDNLFDWYHVGISHGAALLAGVAGPNVKMTLTSELGRNHFVMLGDYGHAVGGPKYDDYQREFAKKMGFDESWRERPEVKAEMGEVALRSMGHPSIFPNLWVTESNQMSLRIPKGPNKTEIWWFTFFESDMTPEEFKQRLSFVNHIFGPAGQLEQEDGENWGESTRGTRGVVSQRYPLNYAMNLRKGQVQHEEGGPAFIEAVVNEHGQLWTYRAWADWMSAESWSDLKANHTQVPEDYA